ncbi:MAG: MBL fold metallo-hydrolase [Mycobacterium sp.]
MHGCCGGEGHGNGDLVGAVSRRAALTAAGSAVLGAGLLSASTGIAAAQPAAALPENALITLGVQAGPPPIPNRIGISSALKIGTDVYVIDCGLGSLNAFANAGLKFADLKSMFITHLHADHIVDYYSFFLSGGAAARPGRAAVAIYGPGPAGGLPPSEVGNPDPPTVAPGNPAPGLAATTAALQQAFAYTSNIFIRDNGVADIAALMDVVEIAVPPGPNYLDRSPRMDPFPVMSDENVAVTATLVPHYDVYPAFAFRFDIHRPAVSVTFSGDTTVSENLVTLARGTDVLVHESMFSLDSAFYGGRFPTDYLVRSHTSAEQVGQVAAQTGPRHLIVSHYDPPDLPEARWLGEIRKNFAGRTTIATDGQVFPL